jgi:hypothetical protein
VSSRKNSSNLALTTLEIAWKKKDDTRNRLEEERREERQFYEETISRMKGQMQEMREYFHDLRRSRSSLSGRKGGRGRGMNKDRPGKGREKGKPQNNWTPKGKGGKGCKGKTQTLGDCKPKFTGTCSHCGIIDHMARDCYKRQQGTNQSRLNNSTPTLTPLTTPSKNLP